MDAALRQERLNKGLAMAVDKGDVGRVKDFLKRGADANCHTGDVFGHVLHAAIGKCLFSRSAESLPIVEALLEHKADPNLQGVFGNRPLHVVTSFGDSQVALDIAHLLFQHGADANLGSSFMIDTPKGSTRVRPIDDLTMFPKSGPHAEALLKLLQSKTKKS
jgi:hypothetical protein